MAREMKDSGIEWIGEIPADWKMVQLRRFAKINNGREVKREVSGDYQDAVAVYGSGGIFKYTDEMQYSGKAVMFGRKGTLGKPLYVDDTFWTVDTMYFLTYRSGLDERFSYYQLIAFDWEPYITHTAIPSIVASQIVACHFPIPNIYEQTRVTSYLDGQCLDLDNVLKKTRESIEEYKKLKQAVITHAVTKGIRSNRAMRDSGIEWLGEIPIDWGLIPFRHVLKERQEKNSPIKSVERLSLSIDLGVTLYADKTTNLDRFKDDFEQYKLAHEGDLVMNSMNMIVGATGVSDYFGCVSPVYYTFYDELEDHVTAKYCEYIFRSKAMLRVLYSLGKGIYAIVRGDDRVNTCRLKVAKEDLKNIIIPVPPVEEQREIVNYLRQKCEKIDELISKKERYLAEIENYKKSLIYEYVTGKKEVPQEYQK